MLFNRMLITRKVLEDKLKASEVECRDLSENLKIARRELDEIKSRLAQAEKTTSLGALSEKIAHEINNSLTGLMLFTEILLSKETKKESEEDKALLLNIKTGINEIAQTISKFSAPIRKENQA